MHVKVNMQVKTDMISFYSERQNELLQIQHDNRPVTGQTNRENIGQFLNKAFQVRENVQAAQATGKENVPLNTPNVEEHRPEAVIVEIEGLSQQQRVSSVLQTAAFRRHLENIIRGNIGIPSPSRSPAVSQRQSHSREQVHVYLKMLNATWSLSLVLDYV